LNKREEQKRKLDDYEQGRKDQKKLDHLVEKEVSKRIEKLNSATSPKNSLNEEFKLKKDKQARRKEEELKLIEKFTANRRKERESKKSKYQKIDEEKSDLKARGKAIEEEVMRRKKRGDGDGLEEGKKRIDGIKKYKQDKDSFRKRLGRSKRKGRKPKKDLKRGDPLNLKKIKQD